MLKLINLFLFNIHVNVENYVQFSLITCNFSGTAWHSCIVFLLVGAVIAENLPRREFLLLSQGWRSTRWLRGRRILRSNFTPTSASRICSRHFVENHAHSERADSNTWRIPMLFTDIQQLDKYLLFVGIAFFRLLMFSKSFYPYVLRSRVHPLYCVHTCTCIMLVLHTCTVNSMSINVRRSYIWYFCVCIKLTLSRHVNIRTCCIFVYTVQIICIILRIIV